MRSKQNKIIMLALIFLCLGGGAIWVWKSGPDKSVEYKVAIARPLPPSKYAAASVFRDPALAKFPYAPGWPVRLPGEVAATPVVADLLGDGQLEVVAPCRAAANPATGIVEGEPVLFAFRADGTMLPGWPVELQASVLGKPKPGRYEWTSSPSVFRRNGKDNLVMMGGHAGIVVVHGDGTVHRLGGGSDWHDNIPLVDLDGDGIPDIAVGRFIANVDGKPVAGWPVERQFADGYAPCIGDAMGDGTLRIFHPFYNQDIGSFDSQGNSLAGWPQDSRQPAWFSPVMGDALGNGQMQIMHSWGKHVFAWNPDGTPLRHTKTYSRMPGIFKSSDSYFFPSAPSLADLDGDGKAEIILFDRNSQTIRAWHGDGTGVTPPPDTIDVGDELEIKVPDLSPGTRSEQTAVVSNDGTVDIMLLPGIQAWGFNTNGLEQAIAGEYREHGINPNAKVSVTILRHATAASRPAATMSTTDALRKMVAAFNSQGDDVSDGLVAALPAENARGISVVSLGDDPKVMDFFTGTYWVRRFPDGKTRTIPMIPDEAQTDWVQPTIADVEGNGKADVIFGLADGRLFVYRTALAYHAERMQWPTANGNFQHTGAWHDPSPKPPR